MMLAKQLGSPNAALFGLLYVLYRLCPLLGCWYSRLVMGLGAGEEPGVLSSRARGLSLGSFSGESKDWIEFKYNVIAFFRRTDRDSALLGQTNMPKVRPRKSLLLSSQGTVRTLGASCARSSSEPLREIKHSCEDA